VPSTENRIPDFVSEEAQLGGDGLEVVSLE
jgi:hypothetical protein